MTFPNNNTITVYSTTWCPDCHRAKRFLGEQRIPYTNVDIEQDPATVLADGRVLAAGGYYLDAVRGELVFDEAEIYNPATGSWQYTGSLNVARRFHTATTLADGRILVAAGRNQNNAWLDSAD